MATVLDRELKRQITVDGADYTVAFDPEGIRLTGKGKRKPEVDLRWRDLLSGEAALAVALNASLSMRAQPADKTRAAAPTAGALPAPAAVPASAPAPAKTVAAAGRPRKRTPKKAPTR